MADYFVTYRWSSEDDPMGGVGNCLVERSHLVTAKTVEDFRTSTAIDLGLDPDKFIITFFYKLPEDTNQGFLGAG